MGSIALIDVTNKRTIHNISCISLVEDGFTCSVEVELTEILLRELVFDMERTDRLKEIIKVNS